jgi:aminoglycoside phosphotransferase (APT) family kinase protein
VLISAKVVAQLIAEQFPQWAYLPLMPLKVDGWDNTTFRLGDDLSVRLPNEDANIPQVEKESTWLPVIEAGVSCPVPTVLAIGKPTDAFPRPWSIRSWLPGTIASLDSIDDLPKFAHDLATFLRSLRMVDVTNGPAAGSHSHHRGSPLQTYSKSAIRAISSCANDIDADAVTRAWETALDATSQLDPVWFHGDVSASNLLIDNGKLSAVIDFGCCGVGDPACDLAIAWTFLDTESRTVFEATNKLDDNTWERGRGWALWKALLVLEDSITGAGTSPEWHHMGWRTDARNVIHTILATS